MNGTAGKPEVSRFFIEKYKKLVKYFQTSYSDLSEMEVEDIVSDLMTDLLGRSEIMDRVENTSAYIFQSIRNKINDYLRRKKKTVSLESSLPDTEGGQPPETVQEPSYDMTVELEAAEIRGRLIQALDALEPNQRAVWVATELEGRSFRKLSEEWQTPVGTLLARKHRANAALQKALQDYRNQ